MLKTLSLNVIQGFAESSDISILGDDDVELIRQKVITAIKAFMKGAPLLLQKKYSNKSRYYYDM